MKLCWNKLDISKWKDIVCLCIRRLNILQVSTLPNEIYRFSASLIKIPMAYFAEIEKSILKFPWNLKGPWNSHGISRGPILHKTDLRENKVGGLTCPNFQIYYKATIIITVWFWWHIDQRNRIGRPEINPCIYDQMSFDKDTKTIQWRNNFSRNVLGNWNIHAKDVGLTLYYIQKF